MEISIIHLAKEPKWPKLGKKKSNGVSHSEKCQGQGKKIPTQMKGKTQHCRTKGELKKVA